MTFNRGHVEERGSPHADGSREKSHPHPPVDRARGYLELSCQIRFARKFCEQGLDIVIFSVAILTHFLWAPSPSYVRGRRSKW